MTLRALFVVVVLAFPGVAKAYSEDGATVQVIVTEGAVGASTPTGCTAVARSVQFCDDALGWTSTAVASPEIDAAYRIDASHYAQFLIEDVGSDDGLTATFMRQAVLDNAGMASSTTPELLDVQPVTLGLLSGDTVVYKARINGMDVIFANSVFLQRKRVMQIMTYAIGGDYTPEHAGYQAKFLANTKLAE